MLVLINQKLSFSADNPVNKIFDVCGNRCSATAALPQSLELALGYEVGDYWFVIV